MNVDLYMVAQRIQLVAQVSPSNYYNTRPSGICSRARDHIITHHRNQFLVPNIIFGLLAHCLYSIYTI